MNWRNGPGSRGNPGNPRVFEPDATHLMRDDFTERAARHVARHDPPPSAAAVIPYEMRHGPWTAYNQLGNAAAFAPDNNNEQSILRLDEWGMPEVWTVSLGMNFNFDAYPSNNYFDVTAIIDYGSGGTTQRVEVDWLNGNSIALPMNALNVTARYNLSAIATAAYGAPAAPTDLQLSVMVSRGNQTKTKPRRTVFADSNDLVPIPPFASELIWSPVNPTLANLRDIYNIAVAQRTIEFDGGGPGATFANVGQFETPQSVEYLTLDAAGVIQGIGRPIPLPIPIFARKVFLINIAPNIIYSYQFLLSI